jgi:hypothetical protein
MDEARVIKWSRQVEWPDRRTKTGVRMVPEVVIAVHLPDGSIYMDYDGEGFGSDYAAESYARGWNDGRRAQ